MAGVEAAPKLRHAETEEKVVLPSADGKSYYPALTVSLTTQRRWYEDYFLNFFIALSIHTWDWLLYYCLTTKSLRIVQKLFHTTP